MNSTRPPTKVGLRSGALGLVLAMLIGLSVCAAGGPNASAAGAQVGTGLTARSSAIAAVATERISPRSVRSPEHTVWHAGEATVTGSIAPGMRLRVHAVLNRACRVGAFTTATCLPQALLGWETITEDGTFSPVPTPAAPYGVCQGDTVRVVQGHPHVISGQLFPCFTSPATN